MDVLGERNFCAENAVAQEIDQKEHLLCKAASMTFCPRIATSPIWPAGTGLPSLSRIATWQPVAKPTGPGFLFPGGRGLLAIWCGR